jgi:hypothetical protein
MCVAAGHRLPRLIYTGASHISPRASWGGYAADGPFVSASISPELLNAQNKTFLPPGLRHELAQRLRTGMAETVRLGIKYSV